MDKFVVYININSKVIEYVLPALDNRKGMLNFFKHTQMKNMFLSFEVWDGVWHFLSNAYVRLSKDHKVLEDYILKDKDIISGKVRETGTRFSMMISEMNEDVSVYKKYDIRGLNNIVIGGSREAQIQINDRYISNIHTEIYRNQNEWYITDCSRNGTHLNGEMISADTKLTVFDTIYLVGVKIIFLGEMLAINKKNIANVFIPELDPLNAASSRQFKDNSLFSRSPRFIEPFDTEKIEIEMPPSKNKQRKTPMIFILGPSLTMPLPILATVFFNIMLNRSKDGSTNPLSYFGMAISVLMFSAIGIMWTVLRNRYDKKVQIEEEELRISAYENYIQQNTLLIEDKQTYNRSLLENKYFPSRYIVKTIREMRNSLWNRNVNHEDFLQIRMGTGSIASPNEILVPKERFSVVNDYLVSRPKEVYEKYKNVHNAVKLLDLQANKIIGVIGENESVASIARNMIVQIAALHAYTDVKMAFLYTKADKDNYMEFTKWLPHTFSQDKKLRYTANSGQTFQNVLYALTSELRSREEAMKEVHKKAVFKNRYIVFCTSKQIFDNETIYKYMVSGMDYGFTFILLYGEMDALPNECKMIVECSKSYSGMYKLDESFDELNVVQFDGMKLPSAEKFARHISGLYINELLEGEIPEAIDFFEMSDIANIEQWDLLKHYKENRSFEGIRALVGITAGNKPMYLDIHEKKHGPHGLVAGTTGSGKSETIQTFILSLALNYHPAEVSFIIIDYKGGGMANVFTGLPHLAGTITNLGADDGEMDDSIDENQIRRALISIRSEIKRRQMIFNQHKVNHIDLYMRLYREKKAKDPMPHLIIISDEFAELKKEQPDFIKELVSTARVGRSLGIHLILATQKPAGVVDDEIWSNSRFKLCLRVQDKQDSMGMLKRPEAAYLTTTGRAYMQIGNDEIFEMFQSGYSGAPYDPKEAVVSVQDEEVSMIELDGTPSVVKHKNHAALENAPTQLETCVEYIRTTAQKHSIANSRALWMPQLPNMLYLDDLEKRYSISRSEGLTAVLGLVDYPEKQAQYPFTVDIDQCSNIMIVGNAGSGKSTMVQTMLFSLVTHNHPSRIQFYCMDFSSGTLRIFEKLPHCGGVIFSDNEEGVTRLCKLAAEIMDERKKLFVQKGVGSYTEYRKVSDGELPTVLIVLDNYFEFLETYPELEDTFLKLTRDGSKYGVQFIVTVNRMSDMRYKVRQNFTKVIPLLLLERGDYMEALGKGPDFMPGSIRGRGLLMEEQILEYQTALPVYGESELERAENMKDRFAKYCDSYEGVYAKQIPMLRAEETYEEYLGRNKEAAQRSMLPLGYEMESLEVYSIDLKKDYCYIISDNGYDGIQNMLMNFVRACEYYKYSFYYISLQQGKMPMNSEMLEGYCQDYDSLYMMLLKLKQEFSSRSSARKEFLKENPQGNAEEYMDRNFAKIFVLIEDMGEFCSLIYGNLEGKEAVSPIIEVFFKQGSRCGIYFAAGFSISIDPAVLYTAACKNYLSYKTGIHLGGALNQQKMFDFQMPIGQQMKELPANIGFIQKNQKPCQIFIPWDKAR